MSFRLTFCGQVKELYLGPFAFSYSFEHLGIDLLDSGLIRAERTGVYLTLHLI